MHECLKTLISNTQTIRAIPELVELTKTHKSAVMRESAMEYLHLALVHWSPTHLQKQIPHLSSAIQSGLRDASKKCREWARLAYWQVITLHSYW